MGGSGGETGSTGEERGRSIHHLHTQDSLMQKGFLKLLKKKRQASCPLTFIHFTFIHLADA